jgi:phospholipase/carboxylesterase
MSGRGSPSPLPSTAGALPPHAGEPVGWAGAPLGGSPAAAILVHGRNAGPRNILDLARALDRPRFTYLAPGAAGSTWYPHSFLAPYDANEPGRSSGLSVIRSLVDQVVDAGVDRERVLLLGFSQGACLTAEFAYRNPARYGGVILYTGGLLGPPGTTWETHGNFGGTPVFLGCSDVDGHVPEERVHESAEVFEAMGARVTKRIYPGMGHVVNDDEIAFTRELMDHLLGP